MQIQGIKILIISCFLQLATFSDAENKVICKFDAETGKRSDLKYSELYTDPMSKRKCYRVNGRRYIFSTKIFNVQADKYYIASVWVKSISDSSSYAHLGVEPLDENEELIKYRHVAFVKNSFTELVASCKPFDTIIKIKNGAFWKKSNRCVVAFDAKKDKSDIPNRNVSAPIKNIEKQEKFYEVTLSSPVARVLPSGTKIREHYIGSYHYLIHSSVPVKWTKLQSKPIKGSEFRGGSKAKLLLICNSKDKKKSMLFDDFMLKEMDSSK